MVNGDYAEKEMALRKNVDEDAELDDLVDDPSDTSDQGEEVEDEIEEDVA